MGFCDLGPFTGSRPYPRPHQEVVCKWKAGHWSLGLFWENKFKV